MAYAFPYRGLTGDFDWDGLFGSVGANCLLELDADSSLTALNLGDHQVAMGKTGAPPVPASLTGTANQVIITATPQGFTFAGPQDLATTSSPTFANLTVTGTFSAGSETIANLHVTGTSHLDGSVVCGSSLSAGATTVGGLTSTGDINATSSQINAHGLQATALFITGGSEFQGVVQMDDALHGVSAAFTGTMQVGGTLNGAGAIFSGTVNGGTLTGTSIQAGTSGITSSGPIAAGTNAVSGGAATFSSITDTGTLSAAGITSTAAIAAGTNAVSGGAATFSSITDTGTLSAGGTTLANVTVSGTTSLQGTATTHAINAGTFGLTCGALACSSANVSGLVGPNFVSVDGSGNLHTGAFSVANTMVSADTSGTLQTTTITNANGTNVTFTAGAPGTLACSMAQDLSTSGSPSFSAITTTGSGTVLGSGTGNSVLKIGPNVAGAAQTHVYIGLDGTGFADMVVGNTTAGASVSICSGLGGNGYAVLTSRSLTAQQFVLPDMGTVTSSGFAICDTNQSLAGIKTFSDTTDATSTTVAGTLFSGGIGVAKTTYTKDLVATDTTDATSTTTGGAIVSGGLGVAKTVYAKNLDVTATTNQVVLGTTHTTTLSATAPSASRTYTIPDQGGADTFAFISQLPKRATLWGEEAITNVNGATGSFQTIAQGVNANQMHNGYGLTWNSTDSTSSSKPVSWTWSFAVQAATYTLGVLYSQLTDSGQVQCSIDGVDIGSAIEVYHSGAQVYNVTTTISTGALTAGYHVLKMRITGKNASSSGYWVRLTKAWIYPSAD
jgi:fibronectin-binding autotransporter adhesin